MSQRCEDTFGSIESAHEYLELLTEAISETKRDVDTEIQENGFSSGSRRIDALKIALYDLEVLGHHICRSKRLLNDLRMVRRLLFADRGVPEDQLPAELAVPAAIPLVRMELPVRIPHAARRARASSHVEEELAKIAC